MEITSLASPYPHWIVDNAIPWTMAAEAAACLPAESWPHWVRYSNDCEQRKRTCRDLNLLHPAWHALFSHLNGSFLNEFASRVGGCYLEPDPTLHGGGVHVTDPGGWLQPHLDYARHPIFRDQMRAMNVVLFLNHDWREEFGGAFELYDEMGSTLKARVHPKFNRAVLWVPSDLAYHGTQAVSYLAPPRVTAAAYYLAPLKEGVTRMRALFVPRRAA